MRYLRRSEAGTGEDVGGPQETPRAVASVGPFDAHRKVTTDQPPPLSQCRWPRLELGIVATVFAFGIVLWCLSGEPVMIALRWFAERVGITLKAVLWILAGAASGIGWALFLFWPKIEAGYSTFCAFYAAACL